MAQLGNHLPEEAFHAFRCNACLKSTLVFSARSRHGACLSGRGVTPNPDLHMSNLQRPAAAGLYDPSFEHDACGIGAVARLDNRREHEVLERALDVLYRLEHRGAVGSEIDTGDGAGILFQVPDEFFRAVVDFDLPEAGRYGVAMCFLTTEDDRRAEMEQLLEKVV